MERVKNLYVLIFLAHFNLSQHVTTDYLLYWIPFYYAFKLAFLLWAMLPQTRGAMFLYDNFLKDFLKKSESRIDAALADAKKSAGSIAADLAGATNELAAAGKAGTEKKKDS